MQFSSIFSYSFHICTRNLAVFSKLIEKDRKFFGLFDNKKDINKENPSEINII
jgi:hypothetical protein